MEKKKESWMLGRIIQTIAPSIGATVLLESEWGIVGQITFRNGRRSYFRYNTLDLNPMGSSEVARDKDYSNFFMEAMGYPTVPGSKTFFSDQWARAIGATDRDIDAAYKYARKLDFPVIVKPNSGSQGVGVALVHNKREFYEAMRLIFRSDRVALVQGYVSGKDYRLVVLDRKIISAYERIPLNVVGNGKDSIGKLLQKKQGEFVASSRDTRIKTDDPRIKRKLKHQGLSLRTILPKGKRVFLLDNANLSTGGDSIDVTKRVHPSYKKLAMKLTRDMGLRLAGVDLMVKGDISKKPGRYIILEINSAPGLDHYAKLGKAQEKVVKDLYRVVLRHMAK